ncbi:Transcription activator of gluconeogenesis ERT1 [Smittium culicis]|uniref:Transcription activator of gluconeogenesis ERT1 n=1 Tax=Smittium culicis TaxID=133412 RepID=A0A1R1YA71_9FUNG|nr:Transcription activator of gluconeogenesis ERT1 [Smittium culicis]
MKGNQAGPISATIPVKISCKQDKPNENQKLLQKNSLNKGLLETSDICLKCTITGKTCVCKKKKKKIAKYLLEDINNLSQNQDGNPNTQSNQKTGKPSPINAGVLLYISVLVVINLSIYKLENTSSQKFIGTPESDFNFESDIVNLECTILSNILDHHHNSSYGKEELGNINFELDKIPDLSGYIDSIGRPFCNYNAYDTSTSGDIINQAHQCYNSNNDISDTWIKGGLAAPNVVKPSLNNIVSQEQMAMSETNNLPFTLDNSNLNPSKFSSSSIYSLEYKPHQDNRALIKLYDMMTTRMSNDEIFKVAKAIEFIRPSILSFQSYLSFDDFVFIEKCHLRLRLEFERLFEFIGTPTVVWRITGEINIVSREFTLMCWWKKEELEGGRKLIFELLDNASIVKYWENFSVYAVENYDHTTTMRCSLFRPDQTSVPCAFSFTIKRDIFGIPLEVVGSFLPILF